MQFFSQLWQWLWGPGGAVLFAVLYGICEALAHIPSVEANSVFQLIMGWLKKAEDANPEKPPQA